MLRLPLVYLAVAAPLLAACTGSVGTSPAKLERETVVAAGGAGGSGGEDGSTGTSATTGGAGGATTSTSTGPGATTSTGTGATTTSTTGSTGAGPGATTGSGGALPSCGPAPADHMGDGTYYAADGSGNCGFDPTGDLMVGAMNHADYAASAACGACVHIVGPSGEATVRIVDQCPECKPGDIDLSPLAFSQLAPLALGRIGIDWTYVPCDVGGPIVYHFKEGSNAWWTAVQIRNARFAVAKLEVAQGGQYVALTRADYNYFIADAGMGPGPYAIRVTDVHGNVLDDVGVPLVVGGDAPGAAQFPACAP